MVLHRTELNCIPLSQFIGNLNESLEDKCFVLMSDPNICLGCTTRDCHEMLMLGHTIQIVFVRD